MSEPFINPVDIPDSHKEKLCLRKRKYSSLKNALDHLKQIRKKGLIVPSNAYAYKCPVFGNHYHLGHRKEYN